MGFFDDVGDAFSDGVDWVEDTAEDVGEFVEDTAEDVGEFVEDTADDVGDAIGSAFEETIDVAGAMLDAAQDVYQATGQAAAAVIDPVMESVVNPVGDAVLGGLEDSGFFDVVDYASLDLIDMSYGDNGFNLDFGIEDVVGYSLNVGNGGVAFQGDYGGGHLGLAWNDNGFDASAAMGIDWGPLPYAEGHGSVQADGDLGAGGEWQGYFPLPGAMVGGHAAGDYQETDDGFRTSWDVTPGVYEPTGEYAGVGTHGSYSEDKDGYQFNVGVHAEAGQAGVVTARGSLDYDEARRGDVRTQGVSASASVEDELTGMSVDGRIGYQHTETSAGDFDTIFGEGHVRGTGFEVDGNVAGTLGPDGSVTVSGAGHANVEGYEVGAHGSITAGPDGDITARGGIDDLGVPDDAVPQLPDDIPGLPGLPDDLPGLPDDVPGLPNLDGLPDDLPGVPSSLSDLPTAPAIPAMPAMPSMPEVPAMPDVPATPDVPQAPELPTDQTSDSDLPF